MHTRFTLRAAVYLLLLKGNEVLLQKRFHTGWMDGKYSLIAGHVDGNESVIQAMRREAREEADIILSENDLLPATVLHRKGGEVECVDFFFVATSWDGEPKIMEKDKCDDLRWFPMDSLPENVLPYIKEAIYNDSHHIAFSTSGWK